MSMNEVPTEKQYDEVWGVGSVEADREIGRWEEQLLANRTYM